MAEKTIREQALDLYQSPFTFSHGYVYDSKNLMVADGGDRDDKVQRVRGWGRIGYLPNAEALQDEVGKIMAEALTMYWAALKEHKHVD